VHDIALGPESRAALGPHLTMAMTQLHWYAAYTSANHEKKVSVELGRRSVESFLPLYSSVRRWKDRRVQLEMPLFPGYVFVRITLTERLRVLQVPGVSKLVGFGGLPVALPDEQLEALRAGLNGQSCAEPHPYLSVGRRIRVVRGAFQGAEGILVRKKGVFRVVLSLELLMRSISVEMDTADLEPIFQKERHAEGEAMQVNNNTPPPSFFRKRSF
jgi:transcription antitermination factor NusG